jgi:radical SAM superfamily enzyme YgiQ (UPF0313 family)
MRVVLVDNFIMPDGLDRSLFDVHPHLGLASIAAVAERENHRISIYDPKREVRFGRHPYDRHFYDRAAEDIFARSPEAVGFTTLGCSLLFAVNVAARLKRMNPDLPIMLGGPHATMLSREILNAYDQFDLVVRHEAEETFPQVLADLDRRAFDNIPGVTWRTGNGRQIRATEGAPKIEDLDSLPVPLYDLYPVRDLQLDLMRIEAGRGCPFDCNFCSTATFFQRSYRLKSPERLLSELDSLHDRYGATEFKLDHDLFTVNRRKVLAFCEVLEERDYKWRVSARTDCVDPELLGSMASAGCIGLYFGIETGSERMQQLTSKRLKLDGIDRIFDAAQNLGIEITTSFITGYPQETREDQDESLDLIGSCFRRPQDACIPQLHILLPEPGTPLFAQYRPALQYDGYSTKFNARLLHDSDRTEILRLPDLYSTYHYYPAAMPRFFYTFVVDAVDGLRVVGHEILSYTLKFFDGRMSALVDAFRCWVQARHGDAAVTTKLILAFFSARFGPRHHLTSLYRFGLSVNLPTNSPLDQSGAEFKALNFNPRRRYRLNPRSHLFVDLHDCSRLLELIRRIPEASGPLEASAVGELGCYLSIVADGVATHYGIDRGVDSILALFEQPSSIQAVTGFLRHAVPETPVSDSWFKELVDIGALIPSPRASQQSAPALL